MAQTIATPTNYLLDVTNRAIAVADIADLPSLITHIGQATQLACPTVPDGHDAYNPSPVVMARIHDDDTEITAVIALRTEARIGSYRAETRFCRYDASGTCEELIGIRHMPWEDPHMVVLQDGRIVAYGIRVNWDEHDPTKFSNFYTEFYIDTSLESLHFLGYSPTGHKDSRIVVGVDGTLGLYIRPQERLHEGKIAFTWLKNIEELSDDASAVYARARLLGQGVFQNGTWGGPNHPIDLGNGWHMIKCHIAALQPMVDESSMVYSAFMLFHQHTTGRVFVARPHAEAHQFPLADQYKWPKVRDVVFPGGMYELAVEPETGIMAGRAVYGLRDASAVIQDWRFQVPMGQLLAI